MTAKVVNHWGKWVNSEEPVTGVISNNSLAWEFITDEICLTCEKITQDIEDEFEDEDERQEELDSVECDSSHEKIIGDWVKDEEGKYTPDKTGEFAAILREDVTQVVWSKHTSRGALCSPCYPGQVDLDSTGDFLGYDLPSELKYGEEPEEPEEPEDNPSCPACDGIGVPLGNLGNTHYFRCQDCGLTFSGPATDDFRR